MKKLSLIVILLFTLTACGSEGNNIRELTVTVESVECSKGRLYSDAGCTLITSDSKKYEYGTPLLSLEEGVSVNIKVKGFNKITEIRYADETIDK